MRLRQVALVARDLQSVARDLTAVFGLGPPFHDPGVGEFGLENAVFAIGDTFLEVVSPVRADATAQRYLERRGGDGGYMAIFQTRDLDADRARLGRLGIRIVWEIAFPDIATIHLHPRDVGAAIVSIDEARPPASWRWAGPGWEERSRASRALRISGVDVQSPDPDTTRARWAEMLGLDPAAIASPTSAIARAPGDAASARSLLLQDGDVRFTPLGDERGPGISAVHIATRDVAATREAALAAGCIDAAGDVVVGGTRFHLVAAA